MPTVKNLAASFGCLPRHIRQINGSQFFKPCLKLSAFAKPTIQNTPADPHFCDPLLDLSLILLSAVKTDADAACILDLVAGAANRLCQYEQSKSFAPGLPIAITCRFFLTYYLGTIVVSQHITAIDCPLKRHDGLEELSEEEDDENTA